MDWTSFYIASAGAAATLVGLLFIAVQFNTDSFQEDPGNRWRAIARSTFAIYALLFLLPMFFLIPLVDTWGRGITVGLIAGLGIVRSTSTWIPVWRSRPPQRFRQLWQTFWLLVGPVICYVGLGSLAVSLLHGNQSEGVLGSIALIQVALFVIALRNSWNLLFEAPYELRQNKPEPNSTDVGRR